MLHSAVLPIFWLDDNRLLYEGYEPNLKWVRKGDGKEVVKKGVYVLDLLRDKHVRHADAEGFLCYRDGFVRYLLSYDGNSRVAIVREGKFGEERDVVHDRKAQSPSISLNPLTCLDYDRREISRISDYSAPLLPRHGVLEFGRRDRDKTIEYYPARVHPPQPGEPSTLPIDGQAIGGRQIAYFEFSDTYIVGYRAPSFAPRNQWPNGASHYVYTLIPPKEVQEIRIPGGPWSDQIPLRHFSLTSVGIVFAGGTIKGRPGQENVGLYLVRNSNVIKIASGLLNGVGVSPSGCKLAVAMQTLLKSPDPSIIRVFDFCIGSSKR